MITDRIGPRFELNGATRNYRVVDCAAAPGRVDLVREIQVVVRNW